jgi:hypothetical protein
MRLLQVLLLVFPFVAMPASAETIELSARPGEFNAKSLASPKGEVSFRGTAKLIVRNGSKSWPAAVYIGIHQGPNRNDSVQVLAIQNRASDDYLVVGYRLVVDGKEQRVESLANVPLNSELKVRIRFKAGAASIMVNDGRAIEVQTPFKQVSPYVSVSSGEARFTSEL